MNHKVHKQGCSVKKKDRCVRVFARCGTGKLNLELDAVQLGTAPKKIRLLLTRQRGIYGDIGKTRNCNPSLTLFEVARFRIAVDQAGKNTGGYHNPTCQRRISRNTAQNAKAQSLAHATGCDTSTRTTSKLTRRVVISGTRFGTDPEAVCCRVVWASELFCHEEPLSGGRRQRRLTRRIQGRMISGA
jgi:hypothetical protein